ncbi:MAG TPA: nucleoside hydrolase [Ktedonobacteraceae bacterium]|nr:nucleoside hydrolase [Ktedonobacteraceae bacterium]
MKHIILDADPGIDDALAFFLALASPEIQLDAITTVSGNVDVSATTRNALTLLTLAGHTDVPVARGCSQPLIRPLVDAAEVHGRNGLGDIAAPAPTIEPVAQHAVDLIIQRIMDAPGEITLVAIGPLTNIALALHHEPRIAANVREVIMMGGALRVPGNVTPSAEFNIYADPHAAYSVFHAIWPMRLVSLDATQKVTLTRAQFATLASTGGKVPQFIQQMMAFYFDTYAAQRETHTFVMHDPLCLAVAFQPDLITWEPTYVDVELTGTHTLGETVAYFQRPGAPAPNMQTSIGVDAQRFNRLFLERLARTFTR